MLQGSQILRVNVLISPWLRPWLGAFLRGGNSVLEGLAQARFLLFSLDRTNLFNFNLFI
jgi:hypothetical protein